MHCLVVSNICCKLEWGVSISIQYDLYSFNFSKFKVKILLGSKSDKSILFNDNIHCDGDQRHNNDNDTTTPLSWSKSNINSYKIGYLKRCNSDKYVTLYLILSKAYLDTKIICLTFVRFFLRLTYGLVYRPWLSVMVGGWSQEKSFRNMSFIIPVFKKRWSS